MMDFPPTMFDHRKARLAKLAKCQCLMRVFHPFSAWNKWITCLNQNGPETNIHQLLGDLQNLPAMLCYLKIGNQWPFQFAGTPMAFPVSGRKVSVGSQTFAIPGHLQTSSNTNPRKIARFCVDLRDRMGLLRWRNFFFDAKCMQRSQSKAFTSLATPFISALGMASCENKSRESGTDWDD